MCRKRVSQVFSTSRRTVWPHTWFVVECHTGCSLAAEAGRVPSIICCSHSEEVLDPPFDRGQSIVFTYRAALGNSVSMLGGYVC
jgi:hypothetical protein